MCDGRLVGVDDEDALSCALIIYKECKMLPSNNYSDYDVDEKRSKPGNPSEYSHRTSSNNLLGHVFEKNPIRMRLMLLKKSAAVSAALLRHKNRFIRAEPIPGDTTTFTK